MAAPEPSLRPALVCGALLAALDAAEGRRRARKRDQTPDGIGLAVKRALLAAIVRADPGPARFEEWLLHFALDADADRYPGAVATMARAVLDEWRLAHAMGDFAAWLAQGAPSEDAFTPPPGDEVRPGT